MAEEEKIINEEPETETTEDKPEKIESAEDVVTEPEKETTEEKSEAFVQLEQRVTALEQRLNNQEAQSTNETSSDPNFEDKTSPTEVDDDQETDGIESSEEIKEMLNL